MSASFTKGPWFAQHEPGAWRIYSGPQEMVCEFWSENDEPQDAADAHLIAAAPELYAIVASFVEHCTFDTLGKGDNLDNLFAKAKAALALCAAALRARAAGESA